MRAVSLKHGNKKATKTKLGLMALFRKLRLALPHSEFTPLRVSFKEEERSRAP